MDDKALKDKFPRLYSISLNKNSLVGDVVVWVGGRTFQLGILIGEERGSNGKNTLKFN